MGTDFNIIGSLLLGLAGLVAFVLLIVFVMVPIFKGIGWIIANFFRAIGWFIAHIFEFIGGMIGDVLRFIGAVIPIFILAPLAVLNVVIGRWSAAGHFADSVRREFIVAGACLYRVALRRPLKLFWLHGILEGIEERVPEAVQAAPGSDKPSRLTGQFEGYTIVGSLRGGGSGGKLYIARPDDHKRRKLAGFPEHVVIKSFTLTEGSSLPQIVRESRALECAKQLGHVLDHGMDDHRFYYVMPYHPGDHLGIITRQLHGETDGKGLAQRQLAQVMSYLKDLVSTLSLYHEGGLWHKDVKPENIIVHDGRAHLVDLGLVTPLKSAMTLTTHGTEYFRDPEMVRQALRGVKVHQVDGAKFDIFAAGAVLYFMIENTFPAHGGLSRFTHQSPEALRWIVRRSMAEYNQRYATAEIMLADLEHVASAADPFAVKPAELPSMRAGVPGSGHEAEMDVEVQTESPHARQAAMAGAAGAGAAGGICEAANRLVHETVRAVDHALKGVHAGGREAAGTSGGHDGSRGRPRLRVTNWWTGEYAVDSADSASAAPYGASLRETVRRGTGAVRRTAREQVAAARHRAAEMRSRALKHRQKVGLERPPSVWLSGTVIAVIAAIVLAFIVPTAWNVRRAKQTWMTAEANAVSEVDHVQRAAAAGGTPRPVVLILEPADTPREHPAVQRAIHQQHQRGDIVTILPGDGPVPARQVEALMERWRASRDASTVAELEDVLAEHDLYGFLHIKMTTGSGGEARAVPTLIHSSHPDAARRNAHGRTLNEAISPAPELPYLLINDHPAKSDPRVQAQVARTLADYTGRGWTILTDIEIEAATRAALPPGISFTELPPLASGVLHLHSIGGILHIVAPPGEGEAAARFAVRELPVVIQPD